jgi:hypothetical protein
VQRSFVAELDGLLLDSALLPAATQHMLAKELEVAPRDALMKTPIPALFVLLPADVLPARQHPC